MFINNRFATLIKTALVAATPALIPILYFVAMYYDL